MQQHQLKPPAEGDVLGVNMAELDFRLVEATLASIQTGSLTPIIKEELKLKIQSQRLAEGKEELPNAVFKEPEKLELTAEEVQRRDARKANNRKAARKCRNKKKVVFEDSQQELEVLQQRNNQLRQMAANLEAEKQVLLSKMSPSIPATSGGDVVRHDPNLLCSVAEPQVKQEQDTTTIEMQPHGSSDSVNGFNIYTEMKDDDGYLMPTPVSFSGRYSRASIESATSSVSDDFADQPLISPGYLRHVHSSMTPPPPYRPLATPYFRPCQVSPGLRSRTSTESFTSSTFDDDFNYIYMQFPQPSTSTDTFCRPCESPSADRPCESPADFPPCESPVVGQPYQSDGKPGYQRSMGNCSMIDYFLNKDEAVVPESFEYTDDDQSHYCD